MARFTILGSTGFIGSHLARFLEAGGELVEQPSIRSAMKTDYLGHVIYCIGLTADFRSRPYDTMNAHISLLGEILRPARFDSLLYLSSTRVYGRADATGEEAMLPVSPSAPGDLYNISKLAGEALCLGHDNPAVRVARLSNVYGGDEGGTAMQPDNFLAAITSEATGNGHVRLLTAPESCKDYIDVADVARALRLVSLCGRERLYNVAAGVNVTNRELVTELSRLTGCSTSVEPDAPTMCYHPIETDRLIAEFAARGEAWNPSGVIDGLDRIVAQLQPEPLRRAGGKV